MKNKNAIKTWQKFSKNVRATQGRLLPRLGDFHDSILIAGCQRSGTTMLARIITQSEGMVNYWFGPDDELDAALILSGQVQHEVQGRYCFQTTFLNERYQEYFEHPNYRMLWVLRNPHSVVYSMLHNWKSFGLNELFKSCGIHSLCEECQRRYRFFGTLGVPRLIRACSSYNAKTSQIIKLREHLAADRLQVVDYDDLVRNKLVILPKIYEFLAIPYENKYAEEIRSSSVSKSKRASRREKAAVEEICIPEYLRLRRLITIS